VADISRTLPIGERIGNYQIEDLVGSGGMGVVYKARDLRLDRTVALKFLPHDWAVGEREKERFLQEAKSASALDHANVGVIHGLEETGDGQLFIVMAYYEGETLAKKIRTGPLGVAQALNIAMQMARGLAEAHAKNIIHRDIKPSNVIITSQGVAKIVDFGLARVVTSASMTQSGGVSGSAGYMSPEQALGQPVDQRTDIWALGVVLSEMLTGRHPFERDSMASAMLAVVSQPPAQMEGVPLPIQRVIYRALAKEQQGRYQDCREMLADLEVLKSTEEGPTQAVSSKDLRAYVERASAPGAAKRPSRLGWVAAAVLAAVLVAGVAFRDRVAGWFVQEPERHVAVLPFDYIGSNPESEAFSQGLMDSLTSKLSNLEVGEEKLWVIPASEVRRRKVTDPAAALKEFGATLVVKGSIQRDTSGVLLTVNLINTKTLRQIGSAQAQDRTGDFSALQDEAVSRLARMMHIAVTPEMLRDTGGAVTPAAYESYLKALGYMQRYDKAGNLDSAIGALESAVKADPRFALGFASLGEAYRLKNQVDPNPKWIDQASASLKRAAGLNDRLPVVYVTLGRIHQDSGKHDLALQQFEQALRLNPRDADALNGLAHAYEKAGRIADAEAFFKKAAALRQDYWDGYSTLGLFYLRRQRYEDSLAQFRRVLELTPDNAQTYSNMGIVFLSLQRVPEAESAFNKSIELNPSYAAYANLGFLYFQQRRYAESAAMTEKALQINDKDFRVWANLGLAYRWLKADDKASAALQQELKLLEAISKVQPGDPYIQSELGNLYALTKQRDKTIPRLEAALALAPDDPRILADVGMAYEYLGDRRQALRYIEKAIRKGFSLEDLKRVPGMQDLIADPSFRPRAKQ